MEFAPLPDDINFISTIAPLEVRSALQRRLRRNELTPDQVLRAEFQLQNKTHTFTLCPLTDPTLEEASKLVQRHALRALDALHLASCLALSDNLLPSERIVFIASDIRLLRAAQAEGLAAWNPADTAPIPSPPVN